MLPADPFLPCLTTNHPHHIASRRIASHHIHAHKHMPRCPPPRGHYITAGSRKHERAGSSVFRHRPTQPPWVDQRPGLHSAGVTILVRLSSPSHRRRLVCVDRCLTRVHSTCAARPPVRPLHGIWGKHHITSMPRRRLSTHKYFLSALRRYDLMTRLYVAGRRRRWLEC